MLKDAGDHLHAIGLEDGQLTRTCQFDYNALDGEEPEETLSFSDASAAVSIILGWLCQNHATGNRRADITTVGGKAEGLLLLLDPHQSKYESLADIADACGLTRAALSKQLLGLKDQLGMALSIGKLGGTRNTYRNAQREAMENGTHASFRRRKKKEVETDLA